MFLFFLLGIVLDFHAQEVVSGVISDEFGTLEGANILIKNSKKGAVSNSKGYFEINANHGDRLQVSYLGYTTKEILFLNQYNLNVLLEGREMLDEVLVIAFGRTTKTYCGTICCPYTTTCRIYSKGVKIEKNEGNYDDKRIKLYPNMSLDGLFTLKVLENYNHIQINVFNMSGQLIKEFTSQNVSSKKLNIDLSNFSSGMYIINVVADGKLVTTKKAIKG